uniref:Enoyl reductase (ER) domain-containing protein n=1 Tax=Pyrodinium bahamense TaxID=73915 RepID=A0A7S0FWA8_9DINO
MENRGWFYANKPVVPYPGAAAIYEMRSVEMPEVKEGMVLLRLATIAVAPLTRAYLELPGNDVGAEELGLKRTKLGEPVPCEAVAHVVETKSKKYKVGDRIWLPFVPLVEYSAYRDDGKDNEVTHMPPIKLLPFVRTETQISVLSPAAGLSAYCAINDHECGRIDEPGCFGCLRGLFSSKKQKTVLVTSAAGAVGVVACQLYKNKGCRVIGVTSTREKADKLLEYGCDAAVAYKTEDLDTRLSELAPTGFDVFMDNVGAAQLDAGSKHMKIRGKIIQVGCAAEIDHYCTGELAGWKQYHRMAARELRVGGFLMLNHIKKVPLGTLAMAWMLRSGRLKTAETVVHGGLERWAECVDKLRDGAPFGRLLLTLAGPGDESQGA